MSRKVAFFKEEKYVHMVPFFLASPLGGDVEKIGDFQAGRIRSHGSIFLASPLGGDVGEIGDFQ